MQYVSTIVFAVDGVQSSEMTMKKIAGMLNVKNVLPRSLTSLLKVLTQKKGHEMCMKKGRFLNIKLKVKKKFATPHLT